MSFDGFIVNGGCSRRKNSDHSPPVRVSMAMGQPFIDWILNNFRIEVYTNSVLNTW